MPRSEAVYSSNVRPIVRTDRHTHQTTCSTWTTKEVERIKLRRVNYAASCQCARL